MNSRVYLNKTITLTREERLKIQGSQYGEHRCVVVHSYRGTENIDEIPDLNEYEKTKLAYLNENYKGIRLEISYGGRKQTSSSSEIRMNMTPALKKWTKADGTPEASDADKSNDHLCDLLSALGRDNVIKLR